MKVETSMSAKLSPILGERCNQSANSAPKGYIPYIALGLSGATSLYWGQPITLNGGHKEELIWSYLFIYHLSLHPQSVTDLES